MSNQKNSSDVRRREFLKTAALCSAMLYGINSCTTTQAQKPGQKPPYTHLTVRPYQLLCIICAIGEGSVEKCDKKLKKIIEAIKDNPDIPVTINCNAGDVYAYQDPGVAEDCGGSAEFNRRRDMEILRRLDLAPGATHPARILFALLFKRINGISGICGFDKVTSDAWKGCPKAACGDFERGCKKGIQMIIPPRGEEEMACEKAASIKTLYATNEIRVRPHILVCAVCQYGGGTRPPFKPDNLPEMLDLILTRRPDISITLVKGADWMMCGPCPARVAKLNACICGRIKSGGLYNEMKDLNVLQRTGLTYGSTMKACDLYKLILERIPDTQDVCALSVDDKPEYSIWADGCGGKKHPNYDRGREQLLPKFAALAIKAT